LRLASPSKSIITALFAKIPGGIDLWGVQTGRENDKTLPLVIGWASKGSTGRLARRKSANVLKGVKMKRGTLAASVLLLSVALLPLMAANQPGAAFEKLRALAGDWEGKDGMGMAAKSNFKVVVSGTTVMETLSPTGMGMEDMVTLYNVDGDGISAMHFCPTNNQPHLRAIPPAGEISELTFTFQGAGNLPDESAGHQHKLVIHFDDANHITETWTWRAKGKDSLMVFHLARKAQL
jgi:hypothetical protein